MMEVSIIGARGSEGFGLWSDLDVRIDGGR